MVALNYTKIYLGISLRLFMNPERPLIGSFEVIKLLENTKEILSRFLLHLEKRFLNKNCASGYSWVVDARVIPVIFFVVFFFLLSPDKDLPQHSTRRSGGTRPHPLRQVKYSCRQ